MSEVDEIVGFEEPSREVDQLAYATIGAALAVHSELGPGHPEAVYEEALCFELDLRGIKYERQRDYDVFYKTKKVGKGRLDLLVGGLLIVEIKAIDELASVHSKRLLSYLKAMNLSLGILINFNVNLLKNGGVKRVANSR